jgi:glycosyltransferase involved in cell wall biosynthesis
MIGVVVPANDEEALIGRCLAALKLAAQHPALAGEAVEIVVVLDACRDATQRVALAQGAACIAVEARNVGIARATGASALIAQGARWLAFTDADSVVAPDWLARQIETVADAVCGVVCIDDSGDYSAETRASTKPGMSTRTITATSTVQAWACLLRRISAWADSRHCAAARTSNLCVGWMCTVPRSAGQTRCASGRVPVASHARRTGSLSICVARSTAHRRRRRHWTRLAASPPRKLFRLGDPRFGNQHPDVARVYRLRGVVVEARAQCRLLIMSLAPSRDRDQGRPMTRIRRPDGACDFQSGQQRHPHVEQRDLRQEAPEFGKGLFTIVADMDFVAIEPEHLGHALCRIDVVVSDHDSAGLDDLAARQALGNGRLEHGGSRAVDARWRKMDGELAAQARAVARDRDLASVEFENAPRERQADTQSTL